LGHSKKFKVFSIRCRTKRDNGNKLIIDMADFRILYYSHRRSKTSADNKSFLQANAPGKKFPMTFRHKWMDYPKAIDCQGRRRHSGAKPCAKTGRGGQWSVSFCVCRATEMSEWLIGNPPTNHC